jgi:hypothetical protein
MLNLSLGSGLISPRIGIFMEVAHETLHWRFAPIYLEPGKPTVRACWIWAVLVTHRPAAPMNSSRAEAMMQR